MTKIQIGNSITIGGRQRMGIPSGSAHVRAVEIRVDSLFKTQPSVVATVHAFNQDRTYKSSPGTTFAIWSIECNALGNQTQIVIHATNTQVGQAVEYDFWCEYCITGELS